MSREGAHVNREMAVGLMGGNHLTMSLLLYVVIVMMLPVFVQGEDKVDLTETARTLLEGGTARKKTLIKSRPMVIPLSDNTDLMLVRVKGGSFMMGPKDNFYRHQVTISHDFWIGCYEVTGKQFETVMSTGNKWIDDKNAELPKVKVSYKQAKEFCEKITEKYRKLNVLPDGYYFSLPTEAQWEYAAGGGLYGSGLKYSGSDDVDAVAWYGRNSQGTLHKVGQKKPNELGIYDMSGNVSEWCLDTFKEYEPREVIDPEVNVKYLFWKRVCRGGSWNSTQPERCGVVFRDHNDPDDYYGDIGFRVVLVYDKTSRTKALSAEQWTERMDKFGKLKFSDLLKWK